MNSIDQFASLISDAARDYLYAACCALIDTLACMFAEDGHTMASAGILDFSRCMHRSRRCQYLLQ
jgi:hypothetical protein